MFSCWDGACNDSPLTRERERELFGPKKRGPKPETFLLKVGELLSGFHFTSGCSQPVTHFHLETTAAAVIPKVIQSATNSVIA